jgi:predicted flap endonuclease-1-like 5' DNA nuclease
MRAVYALIAVFLLLCVFFTRWYLCSVRELCEMAANLEIFIMILAGLLVGLAGSWLLSERTFRMLRTQMGVLEKEKGGLHGQLKILEKENQSARKHLAEWQQEVSLLAQVKKVTEPLLSEAKRQVTTLEQELAQYQRRYENLKQETDEIRDTADRLKHELAAERAREAKLQADLEARPKNEKEIILERPDPSQSRFTPSSWQTKRNDLTMISGIGPAIQRKLNDLGIYSFQQLSELTPEMVDRITKAIKFFPDRIGRDNWIGQAAALARHKK